MSADLVWRQTTSRINQFYRLTKPRVVSLIVFTAVIGMFLAVPGAVPLDKLIFGTVGIALVAGAAAALNCLVEHKFDAVMARTRGRPLPQGKVSVPETLFFLGLVGGLGLFILHQWVNPLTMWLTLGTFVGYAIIYTVILKPLTPQNIVIGGASGAMPPVLGWAAVTGEISSDALLLFLIIFAWTPPHFWCLAIKAREEYSKANIPMLPVIYGDKVTAKYIFINSLILIPYSISLYFFGLGVLYLAVAVVSGTLMTIYHYKLLQNPNPEFAWKAYKVTAPYLVVIFIAIAFDSLWYFRF